MSDFDINKILAEVKDLDDHRITMDTKVLNQSLRLKGVPRGSEWAIKAAATRRANGTVMSQEQRDAISQRFKGKPLSEEAKQKIGAATRGIKRKPETLERMSAVQQQRFAKENRGLIAAGLAIQANPASIVRYETQKINVLKTAENLGIKAHSIRNWLLENWPDQVRKANEPRTLPKPPKAPRVLKPKRMPKLKPGERVIHTPETKARIAAASKASWAKRKAKSD